MKRQAPEIPPCNLCTAGNQQFCHLSSSQQEILAEFRQEAMFRKGAVIFREGDRPRGLFCLHKGKVKVTKLSESGREQVVRLAKEGEILGYRALFAGEEYTASATALEDCEVCMLSKERFILLMESNSNFSRAILQLLARDVRTAEEALANQVQKGAKARVADALLKLLSKFGTRADGKTINVTLSRQEIADLAGVASETVIRTLSYFSNESLVELHGKDILILQPAALHTVAHTFEE